jgi:DNA polymerase III delta subunit
MSDSAAYVVYGLDPLLLETRAKLIRTAGFLTSDASSEVEHHDESDTRNDLPGEQPCTLRVTF